MIYIYKEVVLLTGCGLCTAEEGREYNKGERHEGGRISRLVIGGIKRALEIKY